MRDGEVMSCKCGGTLELVGSDKGDQWFRFEVTHRKDGSEIVPSFLGVVGLGRCEKCGNQMAILDSYSFPESARKEWLKFHPLSGDPPQEVVDKLSWEM
jgi:hypothetical protein